MKKILYYTGLLFIAIFLFITHSKFLHELDPGKDSDLFVLFGYDAKSIVPYIFGLTFGVVTTVIIALIDKKDRMFWTFAIIVALFEIIGVALYNNTEIITKYWQVLAATYYGLYSGFIIIMYAYISQNSQSVAEIRSAKELQKVDAKQLQKMHDNFMKETELIANSENDPNNITVIKDLIAKGFKPKEIAKELKVNPSTIYRKIKHYGL